VLVVLSAGAYGMVMASTYNTRPLAAEVVAKAGRSAITRKRKTPEDLIADETVPSWVG
jgi:diaminopimelate decarboxylase